MTKNILLFFLLSFCILTLAHEPEKSSEQIVSEPQIFEMDINEHPDNLPISESDLRKTKIIHRYCHNNIIISQFLTNIINMVACEQFEISTACSKAYYFRSDKSLATFLHDVKNDALYAQTFRNTLPGVRQAIPAITSYENVRSNSIIPCVFCPNVNNQADKYQHAMVFDSQNVAICEAIRAYNKTKNIA